MKSQLVSIVFAAFGLLVADDLRAQKIETQKPDRARITRIDTALNHLTVIEAADPVEQVAAGSSSFKIEWRGNKVFVQPLEPDAATNLFIWTRSGARLSYELVAAGPVENMHFAIDQEPTPVTVAATRAVPAPRNEPPVPPEMLQKSVPIQLAGNPVRRVPVRILLRDLYEKDGKVYLRFSIRNEGAAVYQPGAPTVVNLVAPRSPQSLYALSRMQLADGIADRLTATGIRQVRLVHEGIDGGTLRPGQQATGVLAFERPKTDGPTVLRFQFPSDRERPVVATLVL